MKYILIIPRINIEYANTLSGLTYGFPSVTHFLGFTHSLSRDLTKECGLELGGSAIICHKHQLLAQKGRRALSFTQSRNPLDEDGKPSPIIEEGKIHLEISLIIECHFEDTHLMSIFDPNVKEDREFSVKRLCDFVYQSAFRKKISGGTITKLNSIQFLQLINNDNAVNQIPKNVRRQLLPGFVLCERSDLLEDFWNAHPELEKYEALLHYSSWSKKISRDNESKNPPKKENRLSSASLKANKDYEEIIPRRSSGWIVPLHIGYKGIAPVYPEGTVAGARDCQSPVSFVEPIYSLGEWKGVHRVNNVEEIIWNYSSNEQNYICKNQI